MASLLRDSEIEDRLRAPVSLIDNFDLTVLGTPRSPVKGASLELTIGDIFVPGIEYPNLLGGVGNPRAQLSLGSGQTAVLRSREKVRMPKDVAGIGFPPSTRVSLAGLLSTNPGHIDPDYTGHLHLTVVNIGKDDFYLRRGDRFMRVLLFELSGESSFPIGEPPSPLTEELLNRLSHDFLDVDNRARKAAKAEELSLRARQVWATVFTAFVTAALALGYQFYSQQKELVSQISKIEGKLGSLGGSLNILSFDEQTKQLKILDERLKKIETTSSR